MTLFIDFRATDPALVRTLENHDVAGPSAEVVEEILKEKGTAKPNNFKKILREQGAKALAKAMREHDNVLLTDTTWRDAHQSLLATRMRTADFLKAAKATNAAFNSADVFSLEMWGKH